MKLRKPPARLKHVPQIALDAAGAAVGYDWDRITADAKGAVTIHNTPQVQSRRPVPAPAPKITAPIGPTPAVLRGLVRREPTAAAAVAVEAPAPPAFTQPSPPKPQPIPRFRRPNTSWLKIRGIAGEGDWELVGLSESAYTLSRQVANGIPPEATIEYHPEVLALAGVDLAAAEAVARKPERVEIAAKETAANKHPMLTFRRGDVTVVLGFRNPHVPKMVAAYFSSEALKEYQNARDGVGGGGGGGARKTKGVPTRPDLLRRRLEAMGADVNDDEGGRTATVRYAGENLGQITIIGYTKQGVGNDFQSMQRKIQHRKQYRQQKGA
jgi:hypothetical protein